MRAMTTVMVIGLGGSLLLGSPSSGQEAPAAWTWPVEYTLNDDVRVDEFAWLRDKASPNVIEYLEAENAYTRASMTHTEQLQKTLYDEMLGRIKQTDLSVPYRDGDYFYYSRTVEGLDYPLYCRKRGSLDAAEQILLDVNELAEGHEYFRITSRDVSPDQRLLAYAVDTTGYEAVDVSVKDLRTGEVWERVITGAGPWGLTWAADGSTLFYTRTDKSKRTDRIYRHTLGADAGQDVLVAREDDPKFSIGVRRTRSDEMIIVETSSSTTTEARFVEAARPTASFRVVAAKRQGVQYGLDHRRGPAGGWFYIWTDADDSPNYKVVRTKVASPGPANWTSVIPHAPDVLINGVSILADHMVVRERRGGYTALRVRRFADGAEHAIETPELVCSISPATNAEYDSDTFRFSYTSLVTPRSVFDYDLDSRERRLLKQTEVLGGYDPSRYESGRLYATAPDGVRVPISFVHRRGLELDGENPCLLYGYGSYGASMDPRFSSNNLSLLDRGFVYAIAHIRGGSEMGRHWKEDGKMLHKRNTFTDFIACAETLIEQDYTSTDRLAIKGGSAGGLLIGAVVNMRPDLFAAAHAAVPFVDVINTMLDASIPLTTGEYEEWGNPYDAEFYRYMKTYSPYDNVRAQDYPDLLITAGLNDPRVHYWEPAKWAARLRATKTDENLLLLKTNMGAGHGGASGRYGRYEELAMEYAFIIDRVAIPSAAVQIGGEE